MSYEPYAYVFDNTEDVKIISSVIQMSIEAAGFYCSGKKLTKKSSKGCNWETMKSDVLNLELYIKQMRKIINMHKMHATWWMGSDLVSIAS